MFVTRAQPEPDHVIFADRTESRPRSNCAHLRFCDLSVRSFSFAILIWAVRALMPLRKFSEIWLTVCLPLDAAARNPNARRGKINNVNLCALFFFQFDGVPFSAPKISVPSMPGRYTVEWCRYNNKIVAPIFINETTKTKRMRSMQSGRHNCDCVAAALSTKQNHSPCLSIASYSMPIRHTNECAREIKSYVSSHDHLIASN